MSGNIKSQEHLAIFGKPTFIRAVIEGPFRIPASMEGEACFYYLKEGLSNIYSRKGTIKTKANQGLLLKCGSYINEYPALEAGKPCSAIGIHLHPEVLRMVYDKDFPNFLLDVEKVTPINYELYEATALLKSFVESLEFYFNNPKLVSDEILKLKLKELMLILAKTDNLVQVKSLLAGLLDKSIIDFKTVISSNIFNNLSVEELAVLCNLSLSSFKREFKKHYNSSPAKYIKYKRLEKAQHLLVATNLRITDIAYDTGFADLAHFSKSFLKVFGISPSDYRLDEKSKSLN